MLMILPQIKSDFIKQHLQALQISSELTRWFRRAREPHVVNVTVEGVIAALNREGINPVLMGAHGINVYRSETRATQDVDVLVIKKDVRKAVRILAEEYPYLELRDSSAVARLSDPITQKPVIDVMKPSSMGIQIVFRHTIRIGNTHRIPSLEMALISKHLAMNGPQRRETKRLLDLSDFRDMVEYNRERLDLDRLKRIADLLNPKRGDAILKIVKDIDAGRNVRL